MSRTSRVLASTSLAYVQMALTTLINLWWTPFLLRHFSQHDYGLWAAGLPMLMYVGLVDFGVITVLQRDVAFALGSAGGDFRKATELPSLVGRTLRLVLIQLPVLCVAALLVWIAIAMHRDWEALRTPFAIVLAALVVSFPLRINHALLMGLQDLSFVAKLSMINWVICISSSAALVLLGWGLRGLAISWAACQITTNLAYYVRVKTRFPGTLQRGLPSLPASEAADRLRKGFWIILSQLAAILLNGSDMIVIAYMLGPASVVPYAITGKLIALLANLPQHITVSAQPALSELRSSPERKRLAEICLALTQAVLLASGFIGAIVIAVDRGFVAWWVGAQLFAGGKVVLLFAASMVLNHWWVTTTSAIFSFGYERRISVTTIANGIVTLGATVACVRYFGIAGAPIASIIGLVAVALPANLLAVAHETGRSMRANLLSLAPWAWRFGLVAVALAFAARLWVPSSLVKLAATSIAVALVYAAVMLPLLLREPLGTYARPRIAALRTRLVGERA
jgi:O-antigen/teichoic acid export membrane protein